MHMQNVLALFTSVAAPEPPVQGDAAAYGRYLDTYRACLQDRDECRAAIANVVNHLGLGVVQGAGVASGIGVVAAEKVVEWVKVAGAEVVGAAASAASSETGGVVKEAVVEVAGAASRCVSGECVERGKHYLSNLRKKQRKREKKQEDREERGKFVPEWRRGAQSPVAGGSRSLGGATASVCTVDTRTGIEIAAAQTLAARRVAENEKFEAEAKVAKKMAEYRLRALQDKDRTIVVDRLAAARYEQRINEARLRAQKSFSESDDSLKSLGSMGSAGELYAKQAIKKSKDNEKLLKYVQEQAEFLLQHATPEIRQRVAEMPEPEYEDEFEVFGDCPEDYNEEQRQAYYDDLNWRNANHGLVDSGPAPPRRELSPEELLQVEEEIRVLSAY